MRGQLVFEEMFDLVSDQGSGERRSQGDAARQSPETERGPVGPVDTVVAHRRVQRRLWKEQQTQNPENAGTLTHRSGSSPWVGSGIHGSPLY